MSIPILFLGDSPDLRGGLSRIMRDLAVLTSSLPEFRVGTLGRGGFGSRQLPFAQYNFGEQYQWGEALIEKVWDDFAGGERGVIFTIWDASRLHWFSLPQQNALPESLYKFLASGRFRRWGYFPVDAQGPTGNLSALGYEATKGYDRVLAYTIFGGAVLKSDFIPHGINTDKFTPRGMAAGRMTLGLKENDIVIGCCMTNQARKDWGLAFSTMAEVYRKNHAIRFWCHIDALQRSHAWDIMSLIADYQAKDWVKVTISGNYNDTEMSYLYSACDLTILPSLGEGFGYPVVESMSCGVPVVTGAYGGSAELIPDRNWLVPISTWRLGDQGNCLRPVYDPGLYVNTILQVLDAKIDVNFCRSAVEHLEWTRLWPGAWKKWMLEGLK